MKVLIAYHMPREHFAALESAAELVMPPPDSGMMKRGDVLALAPSLDAIISYAEIKVDRELLDAGPGLRIVANVAIGYDNFDLPLMTARKVWGTNTPDAYTEATADCTFGLIISAARRIARGDRYVRTGAWKEFEPNPWEGTRLLGKTLGIVGFGKIGHAVARRAEAFGMKVIFNRRTGGTPGSDPRWRNLDALLAEADIVSLHCPLTPETNKLINEARLAKMKRGAILVNMSRGKVVDESALVAALESGRVGAAGLDVFENEPAVHPALLKMEQVTLTPHIGGGTRESRREARELAAENVARVLRGERPLTPVNELK